MAVMYCPKCIVEVMDLINHEEGTDFEILNEGTENEIREELGKYLYHETECKPMIIAVVQEV